MKTIKLFTTKRIGALILSLSFFFIVYGCGGGGGSDSNTGVSSSEGQVLIGLTDAAGDFVRYAVDVTAIKLHKTDGTVVNAIPTDGTTTVDFTQLTNMTEFLTSATVGAGAYDQVVMTLDYSNADIQLYGADGSTILQVPTTNITFVDELGASITSTTIDVTVNLDSDLLVAGGRSVHMALDFNLESNNSVTLDDNNSAALIVSPIITADLTPDTTKIQRFRGALQSVDTTTENPSFVMTVHPFSHDITEDDSYGTMTILVVDSTVYNIEGTIYSGAEGLAALSSEAVDTAVVAHGTFDSDLNFTATEVLAGISVKGTLDSVKGAVISRSGNALTLRGATLGRERSKGGDSFKHTMTVTLDTTTKVSKQFSTGNFTIDDISVGQQIEVFGTYSSDTDTMDATNGYVRMNLTTISGKLNYPASGDEYTANPAWLSMSLYRIETVSVDKKGHNTARFGSPCKVSNVSLFDFTGTGIDADHDASITDYTILPASALDVSSLAANNMPIKMKGFMKPFGAAPEDFDAQTIIDLSATKAFLNVDWGSDGQLESDVFTDTPTETTECLVLNGATMSSAGDFHSVNRGGSIIDFVKDYPGTDIAVQPDGDSTDVFVLATDGDEDSRIEYTVWADFITALNTACTDGALIRRLYGRGTFNDGTLTFSAYRLVLVLATAATTE